MQKKTIKTILSNKFDSWLKSIEDDEVKNLVKENTIITGGCIVSMILDEDVNDFDIYFRNKETVKAIMEYYVKVFNKKERDKIIGAEIKEDEKGRIKIFIKSAGVAESEDIEKEDMPRLLDEADEIPVVENKEPGRVSKSEYRPIFLTSNAVSLTNKIQLINRFYGEPEEIHSNYDFIHCIGYWTSWEKKLEVSEEAFWSITSKTLNYQGSKYPICSIIRTRKFIKKGWKINAGQYLKMCFQVSNLDLDNVNILEDQLMGVDAVYFSQLIKDLREQQKKDENFNYGTEMICSLVDKIFG